MRKLTVGSCFSGIGGLELGLEWTGGFETKWQIENDGYASKVLANHWPKIQRFTDIRDVVRPPAVDLICGGFPCQDVSVAGKRSGLRGKRTTLWREMYRIVCEVEPRWVLAENVPGLLSSDDGQFFGNILRDLATEGYDVEWGMLSAASVGAPHLRQRVFILAHAMFTREWGIARREEIEGDVVADTKINKRRFSDRNSKADAEMANPKSERQISRRIGSCKKEAHAEPVERSSVQNTELNGLEESGNKRIQGRSSDPAPNANWWATEPDVGRVANGVPSRVDRLRCLGNAVVPQVAQKIGEMILDYEEGK